MLEIKFLNKEDIELLLELRMEVLSHVFSEKKKTLSSEEWEAIKQENKSFYQEQFMANKHVALVAMEDGKIAACANICLYNEMPSPDNLKGRCAYLMNVYVREEFRRKGIARKLCTKLIEIAKNRHVEKVYLESSDMGKPLYKSLGFKDMCGYMKL